MPHHFGEVVETLRRSTVQVRTHRQGGGSGVIWSPNGQIVTNAHVVENPAGSSAVEVELWDGRRLPAQVVNKDLRHDVALLHVEASGLSAATQGDSTRLRVGELVIAVGNPLGFTGAASTGVVHRLRHSRERAWVISQLRLAPGNSGGPLANARGEVVGINTMIGGGLAFAVPSRIVASFLQVPGHSPGALGIAVRPVAWGGGPQIGFAILEVVPGSAAENVSLLQGDILTGANGKPFHSTRDLETAIHSHRNGLLTLQFRRGASENMRAVTLRLAPPLGNAA